MSLIAVGSKQYSMRVALDDIQIRLHLAGTHADVIAAANVSQYGCNIFDCLAIVT